MHQKHAASVGVDKLLGCVRHFQHPYFFFFSSGHELVAHAPKGRQLVCDTHYPTLSILTAPRTATCGPRFDGSAAHHSRHDASCLAMAHCASTVVFFEQDCRYVFRVVFCNFALNLATGLSLTPFNTSPHHTTPHHTTPHHTTPQDTALLRTPQVSRKSHLQTRTHTRTHHTCVCGHVCVRACVRARVCGKL